MGIGRRKFLKMFGATIAAAATNPLQAVVLKDDLYINRALGIAFTKPKGWHYMSVKQFAQLKHEQVINANEFSEKLRGAEDPLAVMTKIHPDHNNIVGPSISVYVEPFEYQEGESLLGFLPGLEEIYQKSLKQFRHIGEPIEHAISNCESVEYFSEFLFESSNARLMARNRSVISIREPQIYTLNMFDYPMNNVEAQREYDQFIQSIFYV